MFFDAHNHLQHARFASQLGDIVAGARAAGIAKMVVNGTNEGDWPRTAALAQNFPDLILPAFGLHPWFVGKQSPHWLEVLRGFLEIFPNAPVGEIGLDYAVADNDPAAQEAALRAQLDLARELKRPAVLHCVRAFGALEKLLRESPAPERGFLLHGYGGSPEQAKIFEKLGARFSLSEKSFSEKRLPATRALLAVLPPERLLIETDASDSDGEISALPAIYAKAAAEGLPAEVVAGNFVNLFGKKIPNSETPNPN